MVVDPLQSYLGAGVDLHRSNETRPIMDGMARLAEKHDLAILLLRHLSKQSGGKAIFRGLGSIDLTGAARSEMLAGSLPDGPETRALVHIKSNVGRMADALGYAIDGWGHFAGLVNHRFTAADGSAWRGACPEARRGTQWLAEQLEVGSFEQRDLQAFVDFFKP